MQTNNKLREALETLVDIVDAWKDHLLPVIRDGELAKVIKKAEAALAEPPRNCDRFANADEAFHAWNNTVDTPGGGAYVGLVDWLFAPATEKGGGAK